MISKSRGFPSDAQVLNYARSEELIFYAYGALNFHALNKHIQASINTQRFDLFYSTIKVVVDVAGQCAIAVNLGPVGPRAPHLRSAL